MKRSIVTSLVAAVLLSFGVQAQALSITPADPTPYSFGNQTGQNQIDAAIFSLLNGATELYKSNVGGAEEGLLADSYDTEYFNTPTDPADALITYAGAPNPIIGDPKYLLVKDGNQEPAWYLFNLTSPTWDGMADLELTGFWPNQGAISHVSLYGGSAPPPPVPEPGTILLLGAGLVGLALYSRKRAKA